MPLCSSSGGVSVMAEAASELSSRLMHLPDDEVCKGMPKSKWSGPPASFSLGLPRFEALQKHQQIIS